MQLTTTNPIKKVAVIGPECTGKSELSQYLAQHFKTNWVAEYARTYLDNLSRPYEECDVEKIANGQARLEDKLTSKANDILICDTNLIVLKVWSNVKYGHCSPEILRMMDARSYDLYLLTYIDIPWVADPQREHPEQREYLWKIYKDELENQSVPYVEIRGEREERRRTAITAINNLMDIQ